MEKEKWRERREAEWVDDTPRSGNPSTPAVDTPAPWGVPLGRVWEGKNDVCWFID